MSEIFLEYPSNIEAGPSHNTPEHFFPTISSMPIIETCNEVRSSGRYRIYVRSPGLITNSYNNCLSDAIKTFFDNIMHAYKHLLKDGDSAGRKGYHAKRKKRLPLENPLLRLPICYTIVPCNHDSIVIDLTINHADKAQIRADRDSQYLDMNDEQRVYYLEKFGQLCAYDVHAHCEDAYRITTQQHPSDGVFTG